MISNDQRLNYDAIADRYDEPHRDHPPDPQLAAFLRERDDLTISTVRVLDMGCGTGKQLAANSAAMPEPFYMGLDFFRGMLQQAQARTSTVQWIHADSAQPPFASASVDYISNQFSYPHVLNKSAMFRNTQRILRQGGRFVLLNIDPWQMPNWLIYRYFPAAYARDKQDFFTAEQLANILREVGFVSVTVSRKEQSQQTTLGDFLAYARDRHRASQLMSISDADDADGLQRLQAAINEQGAETAVTSQVCLLTVVADKA